MTTATTTRIIATEDRGYAIIADTSVLVSAGKHDWTDERRVSVLRGADGDVSVNAADGSDHATIWLSRDEARLLAQAILDAIA